MGFFSNLFNSFPSEEDLEKLNNENLKNKIQLLYDFECMINIITIPWFSYNEYLNLYELKDKYIKKNSINILDLKPLYGSDSNDISLSDESTVDLSKNALWAYLIDEIIEFKNQGNINDIKSEFELYESILKHLSISVNISKYSKDVFDELTRSLIDHIDKENSLKIHEVLNKNIENQLIKINWRKHFNNSFSDDTKEDNIYKNLKEEYIESCLDDGYDEETVLSYAADDNFVKSELVNAADNVKSGWKGVLKDVIKYRTMINDKETINFLSQNEIFLNEVSSIIQNLSKS